MVALREDTDPLLAAYKTAMCPLQERTHGSYHSVLRRTHNRLTQATLTSEANTLCVHDQADKVSRD